ncbi:phage baseplate assembly protein V [Stenotrophomonas sp. MMGLT7]|uniref:phage baseplate assembly protein V n=1 Tax=Stenotrophomonas sp. MMGLT7 TaxID=2901227 RepID=UPI001E31A65F|nr:phage baseplate assembly protein V [Stenotrophomonas sp. MMGLT7]MCD7099125.1 phage baseplate assembly protein V [Stenotrophomonas sp. MMGLT7]
MAGLANKLRLMISRAVINLVKDSAKLQEVQISLLEGESRSTAERFQQYGFTSVPLPGAEALAIAVGGSRSHLVVIAADDRRHRLGGLQGGEVAIYTDQGDRIHIKRGGTIEIHASSQVLIDCPRVEMTGDLVVAGDVSDHNGSMQEMRDTYNGHDHPGVTAGSASTQAPTQEMA